MKELTYIVGGIALTMDDRFSEMADSVIEVVDGKIASLQSNAKFSPPEGARVLDARHSIVLPGLINGHTHVGMTLLRGVADDLPFEKWLFDRIFPLEKKWGGPEFVYHGTLLAMAEMTRTGTTTFADMYYFGEHVTRAVHESGVRGICGQAIVEISGIEGIRAIMDKFDEFLASIAHYPRVEGALAPHSIYGVEEKHWGEVIDYARKKDLLIHIHLSEAQREMDETLKKYGKTPTKFFEELGLWKQRALAAHCCCVTPEDIEILGKRRVGISHNPESNLKLGTKIAPVVELRKAGANVCFGTDSVASNNNLDLLQEADVGAKLQSYRIAPGALTARDAVSMLTIEAARALHMDKEIGSLEVGKKADIIVVDTDNIHSVPLFNPCSHLVYSATGQDVRHVMVEGEVLLENKQFKKLDEWAIQREARRWGQRIMSQM